MKTLKLAVAALLAICSVGVVGCSKEAETAQTTTVVAEADAAQPALNIRYVNIDSVLKSYTLAQELMIEQQRVMNEYQALENKYGTELQGIQNNIAQKMNSNGYLTKESYEADVNQANRRGAEIQNVLGARQQKINQVMAQHNARINDSIRNFMKDLSLMNNYDAVYETAATYYVNPELDITAVVIAGLNARYTPAAETK